MQIDQAAAHRLHDKPVLLLARQRTQPGMFSDLVKNDWYVVLRKCRAAVLADQAALKASAHDDSAGEESSGAAATLAAAGQPAEQVEAAMVGTRD